MLPVDKNKGKAHNLLNFYSGCLDFMFSKYSQVLFAFMVVAILFAFFRSRGISSSGHSDPGNRELPG